MYKSDEQKPVLASGAGELLYSVPCTASLLKVDSRDIYSLNKARLIALVQGPDGVLRCGEKELLRYLKIKELSSRDLDVAVAYHETELENRRKIRHRRIVKLREDKEMRALAAQSIIGRSHPTDEAAEPAEPAPLTPPPPAAPTSLIHNLSRVSAFVQAAFYYADHEHKERLATAIVFYADGGKIEDPVEDALVRGFAATLTNADEI